MQGRNRAEEDGPARRNKGEAAQLGFLFEETVLEITVSEPAPPTARAVKSRRDTLPAWARRAMPLPPEPSFETEAEPEPERKIWRVVELVGEVRGHMEQAYADVWVRGEISNLRAAPSGHLYFTLKDGDAALAAVMFRGEARKLRFTPEDGLEVLLRGRVSVYEQRGQLQLIAESLEPVGAGSLQVAFEQLKRKLEAEGLFAMDRKRLLPAFPHSIGMVTSPAGAVIRDFLNVAGRRHAALDVLLYPAVVQGAEAAAEIAAGIAYFNRARNVDVIVIARGGGSLEDLAAFNSELVARAIAASTLPVVSAVGHETDFTIADFVADLRAPTPSAAAELITAAQHRIEEHVETLQARLLRATRLGLALAQHRFVSLGADASFARMRTGLGRREQRVDEQRFRLERAGAARLRSAVDRLRQAHTALLRQDATQHVQIMRERFTGLHLRLERAMQQRVATAKQQHGRVRETLSLHNAAKAVRQARGRVTDLEIRLSRARSVRLRGARYSYEAGARALQSLSPLAVLGRGYALVYASDGTLLRKAAEAVEGDTIGIRLAHGTLGATVVTKTVEGE